MRPANGGVAKWWDVLVTPIKDPEGSVLRLLSICRDVTDSKAASNRLKWTSEHDALTGLANRSAFQTHLEAETIRAARTGVPFGLLLLDLDHFKHINDTLGHAAGDLLLQAVADRLRDGTRPTDFTARLGGDEFAIIIAGLDGDRAIDDVCRRLYAAFATPVTAGARCLRVTLSIGAVVARAEGLSTETVYKLADLALYDAKRAGRGTWRLSPTDPDA